MSHPSEYGMLRFCPKCGVESVQRDYFPGGAAAVRNAKQPKVGAEYICQTCGFGFWISKSRRVLSAQLNHAESRKRAPVKFTEKCVGSEVARAYLSESEPPRIKTMKERIFRKLRGLR